MVAISSAADSVFQAGAFINAVADSVDVAREAGTKVTKRAHDIIDNSFAENLEKIGFLKELWGGKLP